MHGSYEPGTVLTRGEDDAGYYGPDGEPYYGRVACTDLHECEDGEWRFTPKVPEPQERPWWQVVYLEAMCKLGLGGKMTLPNGDVLYMNRVDRDFVKQIYGDSVDIE